MRLEAKDFMLACRPKKWGISHPLRRRYDLSCLLILHGALTVAFA